MEPVIFSAVFWCATTDAIIRLEVFGRHAIPYKSSDVTTTADKNHSDKGWEKHNKRMTMKKWIKKNFHLNRVWHLVWRTHVRPSGLLLKKINPNERENLGGTIQFVAICMCVRDIDDCVKKKQWHDHFKLKQLFWTNISFSRNSLCSLCGFFREIKMSTFFCWRRCTERKRETVRVYSICLDIWFIVNKCASLTIYFMERHTHNHLSLFQCLFILLSVYSTRFILNSTQIKNARHGAQKRKAKTIDNNLLCIQFMWANWINRKMCLCCQFDHCLKNNKTRFIAALLLSNFWVNHIWIRRMRACVCVYYILYIYWFVVTAAFQYSNSKRKKNNQHTLHMHCVFKWNWYPFYMLAKIWLLLDIL